VCCVQAEDTTRVLVLCSVYVYTPAIACKGIEYHHLYTLPSCPLFDNHVVVNCSIIFEAYGELRPSDPPLRGAPLVHLIHLLVNCVLLVVRETQPRVHF
jgi:hypothetical protein